MTLSEFCTKGGDPTGYGLVIDAPFLTAPRAGIKEIGVIARLDNTGIVDDDVLDTVIALRLHDVHVILEVPFGSSPNATHLVQLAANIAIDVSVLPPPADGSDRDWQQYHEMLHRFALAWLAQRNMANAVHPLTGYFQYLAGEAVGYARKQLSMDPYISLRFVDGLPSSRIAETKSFLTPIIVHAFGGMEGIRQLVMAVGGAAYDRVSDMIDDMRKRTSRTPTA